MAPVFCRGAAQKQRRDGFESTVQFAQERWSWGEVNLWAALGMILHEFGHFLDYVLDFSSVSVGFYEKEAEAAAVFLRDYALTSERDC